LFFTHKEYQLMKNRLTKSQLEQLIREQLTEEIRQQLDESFTQSLKDGFASMFGRQTSKEKEAAREKLAAALEKDSAQRVNKFWNDLGKAYDTDRYPNLSMSKQGTEEFQQINDNIYAFYLSLKEAVDNYQEGKGPEDQPKDSLHTDIANEYVELLHKIVLTKQNEMKGRYGQYMNEEEESEDDVLAEVDWEKEAQKIADEEDDTAYGKEAETTKQLKSNKAPLALALLGLSSAAWGYRLFGMAAIGSEYVPSEFITDPGKYAQLETQIGKYSDVIMDSEGNGFLQTFRDAATSTDQIKLNNDFFVDNVDKIAAASGKTPEFIITQGMNDLGRESFRSVSGEMGTQLYEFAKTAGGGEASAKLVNSVVKPGAISPDFIEFVKGNGGSPELLKSIGAEGATASGAVPDAGKTILGMQPGGGKTAIIGKLITKASATVLKTGSVTMVAGSVLGGATLAAAAVALGTLGVGLLASAAAVKALRVKGQKSSRNQKMDLLKDMMPFFEPKDPVLDPKPEEGGEEGPVETPFPVLEESDNICKSMVSAMRAYKFKVGDTFDFQTQRGEQKTAMVVSAEGMPSIEDTYNTGELEFSSYQHDYESDCAKNNGRFIRLPQVIVFNQGDVQRDIAEKKTRATNQAEQMSGIQVGVRVVKKGENAFATMRKAAGQKLGLEPTGALPEGHVIQFNVGNIQRSDENFESFMKKYVSALRGEDKEQRAKAFMDVLAPELRKRRGMSAGKPEDDETPELDSTASAFADVLGVDTDDSLKLGSGGIEFGKAPKSAFGKKKKGSPSVRTGKRRRGYVKGAANENLQETLDRWAKIAGIIKESKDD